MYEIMAYGTCGMLAHASRATSTWLPPLFGIIGVVVGASLTAFWNRRNWQLGKLCESYAAFFVEGDREVTICEKIRQLSRLTNSDGASATRFYEEIGAPVDSRFLQLLEQCELLERKPEFREMIGDLAEEYGIFYGIMVDRHGLAKDRRQPKATDPIAAQQQQKMIEFGEEDLQKRELTGSKATDVRRQIQELRKRVASVHFHNSFWSRIIGNKKSSNRKQDNV